MASRVLRRAIQEHRDAIARKQEQKGAARLPNGKPEPERELDILWRSQTVVDQPDARQCALFDRAMSKSLEAAKTIHRLRRFRRLYVPNLCNLRNLLIDIGL